MENNIDKQKIIAYLDAKITGAKHLYIEIIDKENKENLDYELMGRFYGEIISLQYFKYAIEGGNFNS